MKKRNALIFFAVVLFLLLTIYFLFFRKTADKKTTIALPNLSIPIHFDHKLPLSLEVDKNDFNFPSKLPLLEAEKQAPLSEEATSQIATNLGFSDNPSMVKDITRGVVKIWNNEKYSLLIYPEERYLKIGPSFNPSSLIKNALNKQLSQADMEAIAQDFLSQNLLIDKESLKFTGILFLKNAPGYELFQTTDKEQAEIFQLNFSLSNTSYPVYSLNPQQTLLYVQVLKDDSILNSEAHLENSYRSSLQEYTLKTWSEFKSSLDSAVLVSLDDGNINLPDLEEDDINKIVVNKVDLVYLLDNPKNKLLQPVFLLSGMAEVNGAKNSVNVFLYLPALKNK